MLPCTALPWLRLSATVQLTKTSFKELPNVALEVHTSQPSLENKQIQCLITSNTGN